MNVTIEKITNGFVVTVDGKKTFCDVPEAICGLTSEAVLAECARLEKGGASEDGQMNAALAQALQSLSVAEKSTVDHSEDAFKYMAEMSKLGVGESKVARMARAVGIKFE